MQYSHFNDQQIFLVSHSQADPNAGASRVYHLLAEALASRGWCTTLVHLDGPQLLGGGRLSRVQKLFLPFMISSRARKVLPVDCKVIFSSNGMLFPLYRKLKRSKEHPMLVTHFHGLNYFDMRAIRHEAELNHNRTSLQFKLLNSKLPCQWDLKGAAISDAVIVQNLRDFDYLLQKSIDSKVIPLPVHPAISERAVKSPWRGKLSPPNLFWFGSWEDRKGAHYLPLAFEKISKEIPSICLTVGATRRSEEFIRSKFSPPLQAKVSVLPFISMSEQVELMSHHTLGLFPSISEGFGFALLEALSVGLPCVTTMTGVGGDWLRDGVSARIIPDSSSTHLAHAVIELLRSPSQMSIISEGARTIAATFTEERFGSDYDHHLRNLLSASTHN